MVYKHKLAGKRIAEQMANVNNIRVFFAAHDLDVTVNDVQVSNTGSIQFNVEMGRFHHGGGFSVVGHPIDCILQAVVMLGGS